MPQVMFYEVFAEEEKALRRCMPKEIQAHYTWKTIQEYGRQEQCCPNICIRTQSVIPESWAQDLTLIVSRSQGFDHLTDYAKRTGTKATLRHLNDYCSLAVAEQAITCSLMLLRNMKKQMRYFNTFRRDKLTGRQCLGRHALVVGVGRIGAHIAVLAEGLGMQVKGVDLSADKPCEIVSLHEGLAWADIIFCALPLDETTHGLLDHHALMKAREGAVVINVSRAEITPLEDLVMLYEQGHLAGLALDVFPEEKKLAVALRQQTTWESPDFQAIQRLKEKDNVIFTPHNAFNTKESVEQKARQTVETLMQCFAHQAQLHEA